MLTVLAAVAALAVIPSSHGHCHQECTSTWTGWTDCHSHFNEDMADDFIDQVEAMKCKVLNEAVNAMFECPLINHWKESTEVLKEQGKIRDLSVAIVEEMEGGGGEGVRDGGDNDGGTDDEQRWRREVGDKKVGIFGLDQQAAQRLVQESIHMFQEIGHTVETAFRPGAGATSALELAIEDLIVYQFDTLATGFGVDLKDLAGCDRDCVGSRRLVKRSYMSLMGIDYGTNGGGRNPRSFTFPDDAGLVVAGDDYRPPTCGFCFRKLRCCNDPFMSWLDRKMESAVCEEQNRPCQVVPAPDGTCNFAPPPGARDMAQGERSMQDSLKQKLTKQFINLVGSDKPQYSCAKVDDMCVCCCAGYKVDMDEDSRLICRSNGDGGDVDGDDDDDHEHDVDDDADDDDTTTAEPATLAKGS